MLQSWGRKEVDMTEQLSNHRGPRARPSCRSCSAGVLDRQCPHRAVGSYLGVCWTLFSDVRTSPTPPTHPHLAWGGLLLLVWNPGPTWPFSPFSSASRVSAQPPLAAVPKPWSSPITAPGQPSRDPGDCGLGLCVAPLPQMAWLSSWFRETTCEVLTA